MKANELRIGNWLYLPSKGKHYQILSGHDIEEIEDSSDASPIPITSEWLLGFGFEKSIEHTWSFGYDKEFNVFRLSNLTYNGIQAAWWYNLKLLDHQPEYVHHLQNLFFALTGKELQLTTQQQPDNTSPNSPSHSPNDS